MRKLTKREWLLVAAVPALGILAAAADPGASEVAPAVVEAIPAGKAKAETAADAGQIPDLDLSQLRRQPPAADPANLFAAKSWYVPPPPPPPPPPAKPVPPPPPQAPALPFTYLGQYQDTGKPLIFLVRGDRVLTVSAGDVIEGTYRVEGISGRTLALTYLPLNIRQTLDIGSTG